jgi:signal transduction histidine kinase
MKLHNKLLLANGLILLLSLGVGSLISYREVTTHTQEELSKEAGNIRAMLMATRRVYHQQFIDSGLPVNEKTVGFLPAHALSRISRDFPNWTSSGLYFNNVSDRPRNPENLADAFELEAMAWFRDNAQAKERVTEISGADGRLYYHYTAPLRIEQYCLKCHGDEAEAPASIRSKYREAFGYKLGDLRGIMSIKIPLSPAREHIWSVWRANFLTSLGGFFIVYLCLALLANVLVTRRLQRLEKTAGALAAGNYAERTQQGGNDEVAALAVAIDRMADAVEKRDLEMQRFSEVTTHHLQEPARRMAIYAERLAGQLAGRIDDAETALSLEFIRQQALRQQSLLNDVERYLAANRPFGEVRAVDAGKVVAKVLDDMADRVAEIGATVVVGALPTAWIDEQRLTRLFEITLENALLHGCGEPPRHIRIEGEQLIDRVCYRISDNGPGIEAAYRERVFRVFERLSSNGTGTGIGLAILRRVAESCNGRAWVEEASGGGCCVVFELGGQSAIVAAKGANQ